MRTSTSKTLNTDNDSIAININDNNHNPFDKTFNWEDFKKEYSVLEKKIKKSLDNLHLIQIEFTKQISMLESNNAVNNKINLYDNFKNESTQTKIDIENMYKLIRSFRLQEGDQNEAMKQGMINRFKEILKDHEKEYTRLNSSIEMNKKKLELFSETLKLGELNVDNPKLSSKTNLLMDHNKGLAHNISLADQIISQAKNIGHSFEDQKDKLLKVSGKLKRIKEEFFQIQNVMNKIRRFKCRRNMAITVLMTIVLLFCVYKLFSIFRVV